MVPNVSQQPASQIESARAQDAVVFAYQQLLAYYRGDLADPHESGNVEERLRRDRRWQAHWDSIRYLDLDRAAAIQDAADLTRFDERQATPFCRATAESGGQVFDALLSGARATAGSGRGEWGRHADLCPYCRRMRRLAHARQQRREAALPAGELLLRDWLLQPVYLAALREATCRLGFEWRPPAPDECGKPGGDTVVNQETVHLPLPPAT